VSQLLAIDNRALGDGISDFSIDDLNLVEPHSQMGKLLIFHATI
jgi:hypothetical protein